MRFSLQNRLTLTLICIVLAVGGGAHWIAQVGMRLYYEELTQKLNQSIAMYVTEEHELIQDRVGSAEAIRTLAHQAMIINPIAEVYLLDPEGRILTHALPSGEIAREQVDLEPVLSFLSGEASYPLRGTDPRHPDTRKIFSVAEIRQGEALQGYLYVILGGRVYDDIQANIAWSYISKQTSGAVLLVVVASLLIGVVLFRWWVRPLTRLAQRMRGLSQDASGEPQVQQVETLPVKDRVDEVAQLEQVFETMSSQIEAQFQRLEASDRLRRELVSNISHDLRTPLAAIQGYLETLVLKHETLPVEQRDNYLRTAERSCRRLARMIVDLFELSKLESGQVSPRFERFSLAELLQDTVQDFSLALEAKQLRLELEAPEAAAQSTCVYADIGLIQRVFENLIRNAIAHTPSGGCIRLSFADTPSAVAVSVTDTGGGIAEQDVPYIFDRYYRSSEQPAQARGDSESSGLGLAIVKRILDLHGCRIRVSSVVDQGTRFDFELPSIRQAG